MVIIEKGLKWGLIGIVCLMILSSVGSAAVAGFMGLIGDPVVMAAVLVVFVGLVALVAVPVVMGAMLAYRWWQTSGIQIHRATEFVAPDEAGRLPVPASLLRSPEFAHRAIDSHQASYLANLSTFHYSPESNQNITGADGQTMTAAATSAPQTFWQLYQAGQLPAKGFLMGYNLDKGSNNEAITADWGDLYSSLINGRSGMGKSTLARSILAQSVMQGGRFVLIDPHYNSGNESLGASLEPLRNLMLCDVASEEKQIVDALRYVGQIGKRRLAGQDKDRTPIVLVVDETTTLFQRSNVAGILTDVLAQISQETRKVGVYAMCIGQNFDGRILDTTIRNSFVSMISLPSRRDVARVMSGNTEFGRLAEKLKIGQCVWMDTHGELYTLAVPNCTAADLELVARSFDGKNVYVAENSNLQRESTTSKALPSHFQATSNDVEIDDLEVGGSGSGSGVEVGREVDSVRAQRVITAFLDGDSYTKIAKDIYGVAGGRKYNDARDEIDLILRSHILTLKKG